MPTCAYYNQKNRKKKVLEEALNNMSFKEMQQVFLSLMFGPITVKEEK